MGISHVAHVKAGGVLVQGIGLSSCGEWNGAARAGCGLLANGSPIVGRAGVPAGEHA
jgi:hypothetical protein